MSSKSLKTPHELVGSLELEGFNSISNFGHEGGIALGFTDYSVLIINPVYGYDLDEEEMKAQGLEPNDIEGYALAYGAPGEAPELINLEYNEAGVIAEVTRLAEEAASQGDEE